MRATAGYYVCQPTNVNTTGGMVTLSGTAPTLQESNKAAEIAHGVKGVKQVENNIRVQ